MINDEERFIYIIWKNGLTTLNIIVNLFIFMIFVQTITNYKCTFDLKEGKGTSVTRGQSAKSA
jgi:hypothetical protein